MALVNPFQPATAVAKKLKVLIYGASGTGKTIAALSFPRPAVVDTEGGTDLYAGRAGIPAFSVLRAKSLSDVEAAIKFIQADNGKTFETLVIDAITVLYDVQKDAAARSNLKDGEMNPRLWNRVNGRMVALYNALTNLPVHVVVIARESELYEGEGLNLKRTGVKPDGDKKMTYMFDFVVRLKMDHSGEIIKSRGVNVGNTMPTVNWAAFEKIAGLFTQGTHAQALSDDSAAETDAAAYADAPASPRGPAAPQDQFKDRALVQTFVDAWRDEGMENSDILAALKVNRLSEWDGGLTAAHEAMRAYIETLKSRAASVMDEAETRAAANDLADDPFAEPADTLAS